MTCNICGTNEATIHLTEIVNSEMIEIHMCETCAQEKGTDFKAHFNVTDLFSGANPLTGKGAREQRRPMIKCSKCGLSYDQFGKAGRLGCSVCYESFAKLLLPLIKRVQRTTHHTGKRPSKLSGAARATHNLRTLQERLRKSIHDEAFEEAAKLRDQIKKIMEKANKPKKKS